MNRFQKYYYTSALGLTQTANHSLVLRLSFHIPGLQLLHQSLNGIKFFSNRMFPLWDGLQTFLMYNSLYFPFLTNRQQILFFGIMTLMTARFCQRNVYLTGKGTVGPQARAALFPRFTNRPRFVAASNHGSVDRQQQVSEGDVRLRRVRYLADGDG